MNSTNYRDFDPFYNRVEIWKADGEETRLKIYEEWKNTPLTQLIAEYDRLQALPKDTKEKIEALEVIRVLISIDLQVYDINRAKYLYDILADNIGSDTNKLIEEVNELRRILKAHNHEHRGTWTSPARWTT